MSESFPRSPYDSVKGLVYFPRLLDKIRLQAAGKLAVCYHEFLGGGFDARCLKMLGVSYDDVKARVAAGDSDEAILDSCLAHGRELTNEDFDIWSRCMRKHGWHDDSSDRVAARIRESGLEHLDAKINTMFDFIDYDEGRTPPDFRRWEAPRLTAKETRG